MRKVVAPGVAVRWIANRDNICRKIITTKTIPAEPEKIVAATPEKIVEVVTWECPPSLTEMAAAERNERMAHALDAEARNAIATEEVASANRYFGGSMTVADVEAHMPPVDLDEVDLRR